MRPLTATAALLVAVLLTPTDTHAQEVPPVTLMPPAFPRWDLTGFVGWRSVSQPGLSLWDRWYNVAAATASVGYYWTPHLKFELDASTATTGRILSPGHAAIPGDPYPFYWVREHQFRTTTLSAGAAYQFFDNRWFHPFGSAGLEVVRETARATVRPQSFLPRTTELPPEIVAALQPQSRVAFRTRPFAAGGFKWYVSERVFVRTEARFVFSSGGLASAVWRGGVGADF